MTRGAAPLEHNYRMCAMLRSFALVSRNPTRFVRYPTSPGTSQATAMNDLLSTLVSMVPRA